MKKTILAVALLGALAAHQVQAACDYPAAPGKFPDGSVATREEMQAAKKQVVQYDADINNYLVCLRSELDTQLASETDAKQKAQLQKAAVKKEEAALAEVHDVVDRFNTQLKAWKAKNAPDKKTS